MSLATVARALAELEDHLRACPGAALHANTPVRATWEASGADRSALAVRLSAPRSAFGNQRPAGSQDASALGTQPLPESPDGAWRHLLSCDMGPEFGSGHDGPSPAWLFRASVAACASSCVVLHAARSGVGLKRLVSEVDSQSDLRGMLGLLDEAGMRVPAGPSRLRLRIRAYAPGTTDDELERLVHDALRCSPVQQAVEEITACAVFVESVIS